MKENVCGCFFLNTVYIYIQHIFIRTQKSFLTLSSAAKSTQTLHQIYLQWPQDIRTVNAAHFSFGTVELTVPRPPKFWEADIRENHQRWKSYDHCQLALLFLLLFIFGLGISNNFVECYGFPFSVQSLYEHLLNHRVRMRILWILSF